MATVNHAFPATHASKEGICLSVNELKRPCLSACCTQWAWSSSFRDRNDRRKPQGMVSGLKNTGLRSYHETEADKTERFSCNFQSDSSGP